jgi:two-component system CheB/CheR fusion protein
MSLRSLRVLVAEDTPASRRLLAAMLMKRGHLVDLAEDGSEAVRLVGERDYDVILMDIQMPGMDGLEATSTIRGMNDPCKARLPIVAVTAFALAGQREKCLAAGMDEFVTKPVDIRSLCEAMERVSV